MTTTAARKRVGAGAAGALAVYAAVLRPRIQWLGTTSEERTATYPGDELVRGGRRYGAMATTIAAPPERVWPWLVQMGCDRAGFYSFDRLDNGGRPSADRIHPRWQNLRQGDRIASAPDGSRWFDVALLVPERALVLRASVTVPAARNFDPADGLPRAYSDSTWGFFLRPTVEGHTRLVVTGTARGKPHAPIAVANWLFWDPAHWVMQLKQFAGLRRRAESVPNRRSAAPVTEDAAASGAGLSNQSRAGERSGGRLMPRWLTRLHAWVYGHSDGRVLGRMGGQPVLLLQTAGRHSGRRRTTPVQYLADDDMFVVVASNAGAARPPAWYLNLRADPHGRIRVGARSIDVRAQEASGQERAELWRRLTAANRYLERAARKAGRDLPLMALVPAAPTTPRSSPPVMTTTAAPARRFSADMLAGVDEPVRRYFTHAITDGAPLPDGLRMEMRGRIKVGLWLPFTAEQTVDGRSFAWRARVGRGPLTPLRVTDQYADAAGSTEGRLLGRVTLFHAHDRDTARSAATRAAIESVVFAPPSVLPGRGVTWRAETDNVIVARLNLPPERPEVRLHIDDDGAIRTVDALRWGNAGEKTFQYIPFGGEIHAERRFGDLLLPSSASVGWWFDTPRYAPFFHAEISDVTPTL